MLGATGAAPTGGVLIVDPESGRLLGRGATAFRGEEQAELVALHDTANAAGATLYTTLEPSIRRAAAIVDAGIQRVVIGALQPARDDAGQGLRALLELGIDALHIPNAASELLNEGPATKANKGRPHVTMKVMLTADGMAGYNEAGHQLPLGVEALRWIDRERAAADAVLSGAARIEIENNDLRPHLPGLDDRAALRVVLTGSRGLSLGADLFTQVSGFPIIVAVSEERELQLRTGIEVVRIEGRRGRPDPRKLLEWLGRRGVNRIFVEAGGRLAESFIAGELVDRLHVIDAATPLGRAGIPAATLGSLADRIAAARFSEVDRRLLGEDKVRTFERP